MKTLNGLQVRGFYSPINVKLINYDDYHATIEYINYLETEAKKLKQSHVKNLAGEIEKELLFTDHTKIEKYLKIYNLYFIFKFEPTSPILASFVSPK